MRTYCFLGHPFYSLHLSFNYLSQICSLFLAMTMENTVCWQSCWMESHLHEHGKRFTLECVLTLLNIYPQCFDQTVLAFWSCIQCKIKFNETKYSFLVSYFRLLKFHLHTSLRSSSVSSPRALQNSANFWGHTTIRPDWQRNFKWEHLNGKTYSRLYCLT